MRKRECERERERKTLITDETWTMIKAVDENLANSKDKNTFTSLKTDANQYLTLILIS